MIGLSSRLARDVYEMGFFFTWLAFWLPGKKRGSQLKRARTYLDVARAFLALALGGEGGGAINRR